VPRSNTPQSDSPSRPRSRSTSRSSSAAPRSTAVEAAADRSISASSGNGAAAAAADDPTYDEIAEAAYHRYLQRGGGDGRDFDDWVEAEKDLKSRRSN
jgi:hypothetical protein